MLKLYGWSRGLQRDFAPFAARGFAPGRVLVQHRGLYRLMLEAGEADARLAGRFRHDAEDGAHPVVGDWVAVQHAADGPGLIHGLIPRRSAFVRRQAGGHGIQVVAANVDVALLTLSLNSDLNPRRLERYLAATYESGAQPVVVLTKADAAGDLSAAVSRLQAVAGEAPVIAVSALTGAGVKALADQLEPGRTAVLLGSSGVGKSTLVNTLAGAPLLAVGEIRAHDERGRHTTTRRELIRLPSGALILDTPGMRELGLVDADDGLGAAFAGIELSVEALAADCRFRDCRHAREPGCAVRAALDDGRLPVDRFDSWRKLQRELQHERLKDDPLARKAQQREWIALMQSARTHIRSKRKGPD